MTEKEAFMYRIMGNIYEIQAPIIFKGAMITKLVLEEERFTELERVTRDIDACWVGESPSMETIIEIINKSVSSIKKNLKAKAFREYGYKKSAGICIFDNETDEEIVFMDIDVKTMNKSNTYWYGDICFQGTTVDQILSDKISVISTDKIFRRTKDVVDVYRF